MGTIRNLLEMDRRQRAVPLYTLPLGDKILLTLWTIQCVLMIGMTVYSVFGDKTDTKTDMAIAEIQVGYE